LIPLNKANKHTTDDHCEQAMKRTVTGSLQGAHSLPSLYFALDLVPSRQRPSAHPASHWSLNRKCGHKLISDVNCQGG